MRMVSSGVAITGETATNKRVMTIMMIIDVPKNLDFIFLLFDRG